MHTRVILITLIVLSISATALARQPFAEQHSSAEKTPLDVAGPVAKIAAQSSGIPWVTWLLSHDRKRATRSGGHHPSVEAVAEGDVDDLELVPHEPADEILRIIERLDPQPFKNFRLVDETQEVDDLLAGREQLN